MPKLINGLREKILASARDRLFSADAESFSLRAIAKDCGIAVGTIYNYFQDKESLLAEVMFEDWHETLSRMEASADTCATPEEGILGISRAITDYRETYEKIWYSVIHVLSKCVVSDLAPAESAQINRIICH